MICLWSHSKRRLMLGIGFIPILYLLNNFGAIALNAPVAFQYHLSATNLSMISNSSTVIFLKNLLTVLKPHSIE